MNDLHPDVLDVMAAVGISFEQFRAIYRSIWSLATRQQPVAAPSRDTATASHESRDTAAEPYGMSRDSSAPEISKLHERDERKRKRDREKLAAKRAARRAAKAGMSRDSVQESYDSAVSEGGVVRQSGESYDISYDSPNPSLSKNPDLDLKRERGKGGVGERGAGLMALPADWQPTEKNRALAVERLGAIGADNLLAKFRDHYSDDPRLRTARQWQRLYRDTWIKGEKPPASPQRSLPLVAVVPPSTAPPDAAGVTLHFGSPQAEAWEKYRGKPIPWGIRGCWVVPSEWPPGHTALSA
jgi:hypothetical protein